jgi:peptidoglycan/xylan/chitin deacetylase (PgdA/CDA1 family)
LNPRQTAGLALTRAPIVRRWLWMLGGSAALLASLAAVWKLMNSRTFQLFGQLISSVPCTAPYVALTLDDGPTPEATSALIELLERHGARATFFVVGREVERFPDAARQIVRSGHELGNHSYSHSRMIFVSGEFIQTEIERTDAAIRQAGHMGPIAFRPPYGKKLVGLPWYLEQTGRSTVMWSIEPESSPGVEQTPEGIARHAALQARPGAIILMHAMNEPTNFKLSAIDRMLAGLTERGYRAVSFAELTALCAAPPERQAVAGATNGSQWMRERGAPDR